MYLQTRLDETTSPDVASVPYLPPLRMSNEALWKAGKSKDNDVRSQSLNEIPRLSRPLNLPMDISIIPGEDRGSEHGQSSTQVSQNAGIDVGDAPTLERLGPARKHKYLRASQTELHRVPNPKPPLPAPHGLADPEGANESLRQVKLDHAKSIFRPLEDYIVTCFGSFDCINSSFSTLRPPLPARSASEGTRIALNDCLKSETSTTKQPSIFGLDAKTLLLGNFAENGSWWTGGRPQ
ncbi:MAG: putative E3 ubiquitin-protein ligase, partial [Pleopsidium flavum]